MYVLPGYYPRLLSPLPNSADALGRLLELTQPVASTEPDAEPYFCCDQENIGEMAASLVLASSQFARCPVCYYNFRQSICQMSCSPRQSDFMKITNLTSADSKFDTL